jgi:3-dehydroquinate synthase
LAQAGAYLQSLGPARRWAIVTDETVAGLHLPALRAGLAERGIDAPVITLPPGEGAKRFASLERVCEQLLTFGLERRDGVIALGGGVIGDLAGLAAGLVKRGLDYVQIPTTLLAQVDSSVGGKTAIDSPQGKNLIGLFHQPIAVLADLDVVKTLPVRERRAGYAEIVKYGLINDSAFFDWCCANYAQVLAADADALRCVVEHAVRAKAAIVAADEKEGGARALLNLGHTFGHALEAEAGMDGALLHGEAVGAGLALAFAFSSQLGLCPPADAALVRAHLEAAGFATALKDVPGAPFDRGRLLAAMAQDKKSEGGALTFILAKGIGKAFVAKSVEADDVRQFLCDDL